MKTFLDWSEYTDAGMGDAYADIPRNGGDFAKAVAVCINSRQCETNNRGVMCPSFRLNKNPDLSTGARVRLLKAALNGALDADDLFDKQLVEAMDLCVSCKGCKRECESNVDMARIKIECLAQLNARTGLSLRARLFAGLPRMLSKGNWLARLTLRRNRRRWLANLGERLLGISAQIRLPEPVLEQTFDAEAASLGGKPLILFVDCFSRHYSPEITKAAVDVLNATGYAVSLATPEAGVDDDRPLCCGRTYLSQGMVEQAREEAHRMVKSLLPHAEAGLPIVGLEPSCLLTLRDEYTALGLGDAASVVAKQVLLFEEFMARELSAGRIDLLLRPAGDDEPKTLVHGHCHQKAVGAMKSMRKVLKKIPGLKFEMIEASCCGMAGSFGMEAEHVEYARQMAELELIPALNAEPQANVVANGFSCRHQISQTTDRASMHIAQLLQSRLA
jgi:glycerol-3-phosphate dehydrogenase subunit C